MAVGKKMSLTGIIFERDVSKIMRAKNWEETGVLLSSRCDMVFTKPQEAAQSLQEKNKNGKRRKVERRKKERKEGMEGGNWLGID